MNHSRTDRSVRGETEVKKRKVKIRIEHFGADDIDPDWFPVVFADGKRTILTYEEACRRWKDRVLRVTHIPATHPIDERIGKP